MELASLGELLLITALLWTSRKLWPLWRRSVHLASDKAAAIIEQALATASSESVSPAHRDSDMAEPAAR